MTLIGVPTPFPPIGGGDLINVFDKHVTDELKASSQVFTYFRLSIECDVSDRTNIDAAPTIPFTREI